MRFTTTSALAVLATIASAQRPADQSICDYYTTALLKDNTPTNQLTLLTLLVNTVVIGNYTQPNVGVVVPGILARGTYNGIPVNLLPYFTGGLLSTNEGGKSGVAVNFLDDGGAAPLMLNKPANGTKSRQYFLLTHLYEFFGVLLGCSTVGQPGFPEYSGDPSMYRVHKFMDLSAEEVGYFITQVGLSAASFGVTTSDITVVATALNSLFGYKCSPPTAVIPRAGPQLQAICINDDCPIAANPTCAAYGKAFEPASATVSASATPYATESAKEEGEEDGIYF